MRGVQNQLYGLPVNPNTRRWQTPLQLGVAGARAVAIIWLDPDRRQAQNIGRIANNYPRRPRLCE